MRRSSALTLVEVLVMGAVGVMLLGVFYSLLISSTADSRTLGRRLQSIQAAHLLLERFEHDLKQAVYVPGIYEMQVFSHGSGRANAVVFFRANSAYSTPGETGEPLRVKRMEYVWDPVSSQVLIDGTPFAGGLFKRVEFEYTPGNLGEGDVEYGDYLTVTVTAIPDEDAGRNVTDIDERDMTTLVASYSYRPRAIARVHEHWAPLRRVFQR